MNGPIKCVKDCPDCKKTPALAEAALPEAAQQNGGLVRAALIDLIAVEDCATNGARTFQTQQDVMARFARARKALAAAQQPAQADTPNGDWPKDFREIINNAEATARQQMTDCSLPQCRCYTDHQREYCTLQRKCTGMAVAYSAAPAAPQQEV